MPRKLMQGQFKPKNPRKYKGDVSNIVYRSGWELNFMLWCDRTKQVIEWASEELFIPYLSPKTRKFQRYFPDFLIKIKDDKTGKIRTIMIEIKPLKETIPPSDMSGKRKKPKNRLLQEALTFSINTAKWDAARAWCKKRGIEFKIMTEKDLNV